MAAERTQDGNSQSLPHISFLVSPIRDHAFFKQPKFERLLGDDLLQLLRLAPKILDLRKSRQLSLSLARHIRGRGA